MPTITTTVTSAAATGVVTTQTITEATPDPEPPAVGVSAPVNDPTDIVDIDTFDTSIYEVRTYYMQSSIFEAGIPKGPRSTNPLEGSQEITNGKYAGSGYAAWCDKFFKLVSPTLDVVWNYWQIVGQEPTKIAGPAYHKGLVDDPFEKAHPGCPAVCCWAIRFDDQDHADACWAKLFGNAEVMAHLSAHPYISDFIRAESRYMQACVLTPQRFHKPDKVYEVRNYTIDTSVVPWTADTRKQYGNWVTAMMLGPEGKLKRTENLLGMNIVHFHIAQVEPKTTTINGKDFQPIDHGVTPPQMCWTVEWDSKAQADAHWAGIFSDSDLIEKIGTCGPGNPFWQPGQPLFAYAKLESNWMTAAYPGIFE